MCVRVRARDSVCQCVYVWIVDVFDECDDVFDARG